MDTNKLIKNYRQLLENTKNYKQIEGRTELFLNNNNLNLMDLPSSFLRVLIQIRNSANKRISNKLFFQVKECISKFKEAGYKNDVIAEELGVTQEELKYLIASPAIGKDKLEKVIHYFDDFK